MKKLLICCSIFILCGCDRVRTDQIDACHDRVASEANYQIEIVSSEDLLAISEKDGLFVKGRVKLQNGFGAWANYRYSCLVSKSKELKEFNLTKGW